MEKKLSVEEELQIIKERQMELEKKIANDSEYKKEWEKKKENFKKITLVNDVIELNGDIELIKTQQQIDDLQAATKEHRKKMLTNMEYKTKAEETRKLIKEKLLNFGADYE